MKKYVLLPVLICMGWGLAYATAPQEPQPTSRPLALVMRPSAQQRKLFKQRSKQIRRLAKQYRKADDTQKPLIKEQLLQLVSEATDEGIAWSKARIAEEKNNLALWEQKLAQQEAQLDEIKARRVEEILSGQARERYKQAKKRWKQEIRTLKKSMR